MFLDSTRPKRSFSLVGRPGQKSIEKAVWQLSLHIELDWDRNQGGVKPAFSHLLKEEINLQGQWCLTLPMPSCGQSHMVLAAGKRCCQQPAGGDRAAYCVISTITTQRLHWYKKKPRLFINSSYSGHRLGMLSGILLCLTLSPFSFLKRQVSFWGPKITYSVLKTLGLVQSRTKASVKCGGSWPSYLY